MLKTFKTERLKTIGTPDGRQKNRRKSPSSSIGEPRWLVLQIHHADFIRERLRGRVLLERLFFNACASDNQCRTTALK